MLVNYCNNNPVQICFSHCGHFVYKAAHKLSALYKLVMNDVLDAEYVHTHYFFIHVCIFRFIVIFCLEWFI